MSMYRRLHEMFFPAVCYSSLGARCSSSTLQDNSCSPESGVALGVILISLFRSMEVFWPPDPVNYK